MRTRSTTGVGGGFRPLDRPCAPPNCPAASPRAPERERDEALGAGREELL